MRVARQQYKSKGASPVSAEQVQALFNMKLEILGERIRRASLIVKYPRRSWRRAFSPQPIYQGWNLVKRAQLMLPWLNWLAD